MAEAARHVRPCTGHSSMPAPGQHRPHGSTTAALRVPSCLPHAGRRRRRRSRALQAGARRPYMAAAPGMQESVGYQGRWQPSSGYVGRRRRWRALTPASSARHQTHQTDRAEDQAGGGDVAHGLGPWWISSIRAAQQFANAGSFTHLVRRQPHGIQSRPLADQLWPSHRGSCKHPHEPVTWSGGSDMAYSLDRWLISAGSPGWPPPGAADVDSSWRMHGSSR